MKIENNRYFKTTNLSLAVFLYAIDQQIAGINTINDSKQKEFVFVKTPRLEELENLYKFGDRKDERLLVSVHKYEIARKELLDRLND